MRIAKQYSNTAIAGACLLAVLGIALGAHGQPRGPRWKRAAALPRPKGREAIMVRTETGVGEVMRFNYALPEARIRQLEEMHEGAPLKELTLGNAPLTSKEGKPALPVVPARVVLPAGTELEAVRVVRGKREMLPGTHLLQFGRPAFPLLPGARPRKGKPDRAIYASDRQYPQAAYEIVSVQKKRGVRILHVNLHPVAYYPAGRKVAVFRNMRMRVVTRPAGEEKGSAVRGRPHGLDPAHLGVENPEALDTYTEPEQGTREVDSIQGITDPAQSYRYVIVTSRAIRDATTDFTVMDLIAHKQSRGLTATVVAIEDVYAEYAGVDNQERLRNFIIDAYNDWETEYVLLGGDVGIIPVRYLYTDGTNIPSDVYYQCLDGSYNYDGDTYWGEPTDGEGGGDVDLMAEVYVGRASAEDAAEMSHFVYKTITYETQSDAAPYLRSALVAGEYLGTQFGPGEFSYARPLMEEIRFGSSAAGYVTEGFSSSPVFTVDTLYDYDGTWPASAVLGAINAGDYGIINHLGHANETYVMKFYNSDADALTNTNLQFVYSQGCHPGDFPLDCIAEHLTTSHRHGMFAVVFNSRYGWGAYNDSRSTLDAPSQRLDREFWDAYFAEYILSLGAINADSHEDNIAHINDTYIRWCFYETTLFGDPQTMLRGQVTGPSVAYSSHSHDDGPGGNGDGLINPGETVSLLVSLVNVGTDPAENVEAVLTAGDPNVSVDDADAAFGTIPCCGAAAPGLDTYSIAISSACPTPHTVPLELSITDAGGNSWTSSFSITVYSSSRVSGRVTTLTGDNPVVDATVNYSGPLTGTVQTGADGSYLFGGIDGTYSVTVTHPDFLPSDTTEVSIPPDAEDIDFRLSRPRMQVTPVSLRETVPVGDSVLSNLVVENTGDAPLILAMNTRDVDDATAVASAGELYDSTHFVELPKGADDPRVGKPVILGTGGPDSFGYRWKDSDEPGGPSYVWDDISATGTRLSTISGCDDCSQGVALSFDFPLYGVDFSTIYVSSNGYVTLGSGSSQYSNYALPSTSMPPNLVAGFFDDLYPGSGGNVYFQDFGDRAIVQFQDVVPYSGGGTFTYQMVLRPSGTITYYYSSMSGSVTSATVGLQNGTRDDGLTVVYNTSYVKDSLAVEISVAPDWLRPHVVSDTIDPGTSQSIGVTMDATELLGGMHYGALDIQHNDPVADNPFVLPCTLHVDGMRRLAATPDSLEFGNVWHGTSDTLLLSLTNAGNEATTVSGIAGDQEEFTVDVVLPLTVDAFGEEVVPVVFAPVDIGSESGTLTVTSDAEEGGDLITVDMSGTGTEPPLAQLDPTALAYQLQPGDMPADQTSVLTNAGGDLLVYEPASVGESTASAAAVPGRMPAVRTDLIYSPENYEHQFVPGRVIVGFVEGERSLADPTVAEAAGVTVLRELAVARSPRTGLRAHTGRRLFLYSVKDETRRSVIDAVEALGRDPNVAFAEPDYKLKAIAVPDDPSFNLLYGMHNTGQSGGTPDADIDAPEAWDRHTGNGSVLIGIIDTGIDYLHPDLADNMWTNPGEVPGNGLDDDGNGFVDDYYGWDFAYDDNDPMDGHYHGTHCAGTVAGVGNNGTGVAGVMWDAKLVAIKFLDDGGGGATSDAVDCVNYAAAMDIGITSNSWGGGGFSQALKDAIAAGGLFVAAAGNSGSDNDAGPHYPSSYDCDNIIAVAATDHYDNLASFSCWGRTSVDLAAPGVDVYSCEPGGGYRYLSGTSMATPHASGAAGLVWSYSPSMTAPEVKQLLLDNVDSLASLSGLVLTDGRLNVRSALDAAGPAWLSAAPVEKDSLNPGESQPFTVTVDPAGLVAGQYTGQVRIATNDPVNDTVIIDVTATVASMRRLVAEPPALAFGNVWSGARDTLAVVLRNDGNDSTHVSSLSVSNAEFGAPRATPFVVPPFDADTLQVIFAPVDIGEESGVLVVYSDADDNPGLSVALSGAGTAPPAVSASPSSVVKLLPAGGAGTAAVTVSNEGGDTLKTELSVMPQQVSYDDLDILMWVPYADMDGEYQNVVNAIDQYTDGHTITNSTTFDPAVLETELGDKEVFLVPEQETGTIPSGTGTDFRPVLHAFLQRGGIVIYHCPGLGGSATSFLSEAELMSLSYQGYSSSGSLVAQQPDHHLLAGVVEPIYMQNATSYCSVLDNSTVVATYSGNMVIAERELHHGVVITLGPDRKSVV